MVACCLLVSVTLLVWLNEMLTIKRCVDLTTPRKSEEMVTFTNQFALFAKQQDFVQVKLVSGSSPVSMLTDCLRYKQHVT